MNLNKILVETGELNFGNEFLSLRIIKEPLLAKFKFKILDESTKSLSCRIFRMARLFGAPVPFPNPTLNLQIVSDQNEFKLKYQFLSYDYYLLMLGVLFMNLSSGIIQLSGSKDLPLEFHEVFASSLICLVLGFVAIKLDSMYFTHLIKKNFKKSIPKTKTDL